MKRLSLLWLFSYFFCALLAAGCECKPKTVEVIKYVNVPVVATSEQAEAIKSKEEAVKDENAAFNAKWKQDLKDYILLNPHQDYAYKFQGKEFEGSYEGIYWYEGPLLEVRWSYNEYVSVNKDGKVVYHYGRVKNTAENRKILGIIEQTDSDGGCH